MSSDKKRPANNPISEFAELAGTLVNPKYGMHIVLQACSLIAVIGALAVYWMLMTNFLYNSGKVLQGENKRNRVQSNNSLIVPIF